MEIQIWAFCNTGVEQLIFNGVVTYFGLGVCDNCESLSNVQFAEGQVSVGYGMFYKCTKLKTVFLPDSVQLIERGAFSDCSNLETIYYAGTEEQWSQITIENENDCLQNINIIFNSKNN